MKKVKQNVILYSIGSMGYCIVELLWRGYTHWTMAFAGGICFLLIYYANKKYAKKKLYVRCLMGSGIITSVEFLIGCIVNLRLNWNVWDYSNLPFNLLGQISLLYSGLWFLLTAPVLSLCNYIKKWNMA